METPKRHLRHQTESRTGSEASLDAAQSAHLDATRTFESPEALIAFDRAQTPVPEGLQRRVADAVAQAPQDGTSPAKPWWRRLF